MNLKELLSSPVFLVMMGIAVVMCGVAVWSMYQQHERHATAIETCHQTIDKTDVKPRITRTGNDINVVDVYNVYDVCKDRSGNITRNQSLGYMTYTEYLLAANLVWE